MEKRVVLINPNMLKIFQTLRQIGIRQVDLKKAEAQARAEKQSENIRQEFSAFLQMRGIR